MKGFLPPEWPTWFEGLEVENCPDGKLHISGILPDQAALFGILYQINNVGMAIITLKCDRLPDTPATVAPPLSKEGN